jgi:hypothetical protein
LRIGFLAISVPYWQILYAKVSLPDSLYDLSLLVIYILAMTARAFGKAQLPEVIFVIGAAVPAVILV